MVSQMLGLLGKVFGHKFVAVKRDSKNFDKEENHNM
jgi:hypothetical protein